MTDYADTNFFVAMLITLPHSVEADAIADRIWESQVEPLPVSRLLQMEVKNALQRLVFEARNGAQDIGITPEYALVAEARFFDILDEGVSGKAWSRTKRF